MAVSSRYIFHQGTTLAALGQTSLTALWQSMAGVPKQPPQLPSPEIATTLPPRDPALIRDYLRHVGGSPGVYKNTVPAHFFPQWAFGLASKTLQGIPYPLIKVMNGGCRLEIFAPLPDHEPLQVRARLESIDDNGRRVVLHQRILTGTPSVPHAIVAHMYPIVPLPRDKKDKDDTKKEPIRVPEDAREIDFWSLRPNAGLDFAKLTGDFNPVHWISSYARMFGFRNTILHGFSTMARAMEGLHQNWFAGAPVIRVFDVRFTRPLVLPAKVGLYVAGQQEVFVGDAPGGPAYLKGTFSTEAPSLSSEAPFLDS